MINGIINVYKEKGYTSHDVVAKLRGILKQKKIGHTGTLDPDAQGVLPVCLGNGTKVCDMLTEKDKTYEAVLLLGKTTDTQDISGTVLSESEVIAERKAISDTILSFIGEYYQLPPMYSAIKVQGKRLYELARAGKEVEREPRKVWIHNIQIINIDEEHHEIRMIVECSKGTYIRTLCHDIGDKLGCGGCMKSLLRTRVGTFSIENSRKLSEITELVQQDKLMDVVIKVDDMFPDYAKIYVAEEYCKYIYNGNSFKEKDLIQKDLTQKHLTQKDLTQNNLIQKDVAQKESEVLRIDTSLVRVYDYRNNFIGIYEFDDTIKQFNPVKMFLS